MDERRRQERKYLTYFSRVTDRRSDRLLGYMVDMTIGGAQLVGNVPLKIHEMIEIRVDLPDDFSPQMSLDMLVRAVWTRPDEDPELFKTGLQLIEINPSDIPVLERLLASYGS